MIVDDTNEVLECRLLPRDIGQNHCFFAALSILDDLYCFSISKIEQNGTEICIGVLCDLKFIFFLDMSVVLRTSGIQISVVSRTSGFETSVALYYIP